MNATRFLGAAVLGAMTPLALAAQTPTSSASLPWVEISVAQTATPTLNLSASAGSYVVVVRVSNDLRAHVVYPSSPKTQRPFPEGPGSFQIPLEVPKYSMGGIYAAASNTPFNLAKIAKGDRWDDDAMILQASHDPQHAANRVLGMITPLSATVASSETVYMGSETAKHPRLFANAASVYLPVSFSYAMDEQCSRIVGRYECGNDPSWRGSTYLGCMTLNATSSSPFLFCGTVHDLFTYMAGTYPPRPVLPLGMNANACRGGEACAPNNDFESGVVQWHPSSGYSRPAPAPGPTPASPTPLPAPTNPPTNPLSIPPSD